MSFIASVVNRHGYAHAFCKSSHGHYYTGGRRGTEVVFKSVDEFNRFVAHLKSLTVDDPRVSQYDMDVFGLVTGRVQFDLAPPTDDKSRSITNKF
jgi:hypothetical protein